jgi:hypothetical protein
MHNLCRGTQPPIGTKNLLGLGLKFCTASPKPTSNIKDCVQKLAYRIRTKQYLLSNRKSTNTEYVPQIYKKLKNWYPPPASLTIENRITDFEKQLKQLITTNNDKIQPYTNLTPIQKSTMRELKHLSEFIILPTDKNLGPSISNRDDYIKQVLQEHLLSPTYTQLSETIAFQRLAETKELLINSFETYRHLLSQPEIDYFTRSFQEHHRIPIFYGMPKVHKTPMKLRPVVSCINSFCSIFSTWLDFKMKSLLPLIPSYIKNSSDLIMELKTLQLPPSAKLFTADASSMYTNIDTASGIQAIHGLLETYHNCIPAGFPKEFFLTTLETVMNNNIFSFGNTFWQQLQGTAMGTPAAPLYSILTYGYHENTQILPTFKENLLYYKRYIDDVIGIWVDSPHNSWDSFKARLNGFGTLHWNIENLTTSTTFLDINIQIINQKIQTSTFQKELNLYLYIPPISAHPASCFKGLIVGELLRYWKQNSSIQDFVNITNNFISRLLQRGHLLEDLIPILRSAAATIDNAANNIRERPSNIESDETVYIHWQFHPKDINKSKIRQVYNSTLKGHDNFQHMRVAMARPENLRDILCRTNLSMIPHHNVSDILHNLLSQTNNT